MGYYNAQKTRPRTKYKFLKSRLYSLVSVLNYAGIWGSGLLWRTRKKDVDAIALWWLLYEDNTGRRWRSLVRSWRWWRGCWRCRHWSGSGIQWSRWSQAGSTWRYHSGFVLGSLVVDPRSPSSHVLPFWQIASSDALPLRRWRCRQGGWWPLVQEDHPLTTTSGWSNCTTRM